MATWQVEAQGRIESESPLASNSSSTWSATSQFVLIDKLHPDTFKLLPTCLDLSTKLQTLGPICQDKLESISDIRQH